MASPSYLTKRGNIYWFRRRPPCIFRLHGVRPVRYVADEASSYPPAMGHQAVSLRTSCPREARRRAARANALFEYGWQQFEQAMNQHIPPSEDRHFQQQFAQQMLDFLRTSVEQAARLSSQVLPAPQQAAAQHAVDMSLRRQIAAVVPTPPSQKKSSIDDPEFEAALLAAAEREGWWHDDPDDIIEQLDWMLVGLMTLQEEYVKYCARKGLDPASALPSLSRLAAGVSGMVEAITVASPPTATSPQAATSEPATAAKTLADLRDDGTKLKEFSLRYLDLRSAGYELKKRTEQPDPKAGASFKANSRRNIEASVRLFVDMFGDIPVAEINEKQAAEYLSLLQRIPATHGKSAKDRRPLRQVIEEADRDERVSQDRLAIQMRKDGRSIGEIEEATAAARIERLRTNTCLRHMREFARILDFAILDRLRQENPFRDLIWSGREVKKRTNRETEAQRVGWGDEIHKLLASPIYRQTLQEPGDPMFWAPLLGLFAGLRMEEALQLRTDDFRTEEGVPYIAVQVSGGEQRLKTDSSRRSVPLHRNLLNLGILDLVRLRSKAGQGRIFTYLERGKSKGTLSEVFSKRFTHYRKSCGLYDERRDFHALRTEFLTRLSRARVPEHSYKALMGHLIGDI